MTTQVEHIKYYLMAFVLIAIVAIYFTIRENNLEIEYQFQGVVQKISYHDKGTAIATINNNEYILSNWTFNNEIDQGDLLIKTRGSMVIKLIKNKTGEVLYFK